MERSTTAEASLLSKLESSVDLTGIRHLFTAHLQPFIPFLKPSTTTAKKPSLSLLPRRLSGSPKITEDSALELFDSYRLCLNCLDLIEPELAGKPYSVQLQRIRYIHCLEHWELYKEAEAEGFVVLESLSAIVRGESKGNSRKSKTRLVPELSEDSVDQEVAAVILEIVVTLVKCTSKRRSKVDADYWRVISLVNESEPWFKILDAKDYEKFHHFLETNLHITALFLVAEIKHFGVDLIHEFSVATFKEYKKSSAQDQIYKVALKICSSLFSQRDELSSDIILDLLKHVLDSMAAECKALKALKLCCKASWNYVVDLCKMHVDKSHASRADMSEKAIADFAMEASEKVAFLLELNREGNCKINGIIKECVKCWCVAENLIGMLPTPASLIKEWVKIQFLVLKEEDTEFGTTLYSLLSSSEEVPNSAIGKLLEGFSSVPPSLIQHELLAYDERSYLNPRYCLRMRMRIIDVLLEEVYITNVSNVNKSKILIEKAKVLRANGLARLDECIQCLSNAILKLNSIYSGKSCSSRVHNLLIHAYILRALCTQEAAPNSMVLSPKRLVFCIEQIRTGIDFVQDIYAALKFCLSPDHGHVDEQYEDMLYLWYQLIDLLSIKGYLEIHPSLYDVVIKLFNGKNFPLVKTMSELWKTKRLTHALCASPVNHMFLETFSKHQSRLCSSAEFWKTFVEEVKPLLIGFHHTNNEIKQAASDLLSQVPLSSSSIFLLSNLYYDLSGRLISSGRMIEALTYAKEAHRLRSKLLQQKFEYSVQKMTETFDENGDITEKSYYGIQTFKVNDREVSQVSCDYEGCVLTPWNVLACYLESTLQVGFVQEILGNGSEAEMLLRWGRDVSQFQRLPLLEISFSSVLGKLYCKQKLWSLAEKEMSIAKKNLVDNCDAISCKKCAYMLEISVNQQFGDLFLSSPCSRESPSTKNLFNAKSLYRSALDKLNLSDWQSCYSISEEARAKQVISREKSVSSCTINLLEMNDSLSNDKPENKAELRRSRRTKKELKPASQRQDMVCGHNRRVTRSTHRSLGETREIGPGDRQIGSAAGLATEPLSTTAAGFDHNMPNSESKCFAADFGSDITSLCNKMKCWHCFHIEAVDCSSLNNFICMNWELVYRKLCLRLLISIGSLILEKLLKKGFVYLSWLVQNSWIFLS
ncbi:UNVERIFIED_CONTAM: Separase [Sesamum latifolium]|uniref:Separase n=1 Tax=Sesamum latifolium TaxID=2727402 RepID=A0AAW2UZ10_9LAMI